MNETIPYMGKNEKNPQKGTKKKKGNQIESNK
jgi:hypothetical protein